MAGQKKYYVVWQGISPGIYDSWEECRFQVEGVDDAKYKSFSSLQAATDAYRKGPEQKVSISHALSQVIKKAVSTHIPESIAVDAACSGNPGPMEYQGVYVRTGQKLFTIGPMYGTNNIGEFLAIVHALALLKKNNSSLPIYSDSVNAMLWIKQKKCKTKMERTSANREVFDLIDRAEIWLRNNTYNNRILKWETKEWGEIPADFGRK